MTTSIHPLASQRDKFHLAARDAMLTGYFSGNVPRQIYDANARAMVEYKPQAGMHCGTLLQLAQHCAVAAGIDAGRVLQIPPLALARLALGADPQQLGGVFASSDGAAYNVSGMFSNVLIDAANVALRRSFDDGRTTFQKWCRRGQDIENFLPANRGIAGEFGDPKAVPEGGEFEETSLVDGKEQMKLTVWGRIFSLSWQALVNGGRLGLWMDVPARLGNTMKRKINRLAYQVLKDNAALADAVTLFHASAVPTGHNNVTTGVLTTVADYTSAWNTMRKKMREQKGLSSESAALNIGPRFVLYPPSIDHPIRTALNSTSVVTSGNSGEENIWKGQLDPIEDAELGASAVGGSDVMHYLAADSAEIDTLEYAYLAGLETPAIEQMPGFSTLSLRTRIYFAFAIKGLEFRGLQRHNGA
jgi:hypothetical protein